LLFNGYPLSARIWDEYEMSGAAARLRAAVPADLRQGDAAGLAGWHRAFDPVNPYGLVLINSSGAPDDFRVYRGRGATADVPPRGPAALVVVNSFSAARRGDDATIAGRWLAGGAFVYFGSLNEPYLAAFRTPELTADLLAAGAPLAAAAHKLPAEDELGTPWRLRLVGDPLFHLGPGLGDRPRVARFAPLDGLEPLRPVPARGGPRGCLDAAYADAARGGTGDAWHAALMAIDRAALTPDDRAIHDALLADRVVRGAGLERARAIPEAEHSPALRRALEAVEARHAAGR
jgi:hypothetical protein